MTGSTARVVLRDDDNIAYRPESTRSSIASQAVGELVHDYRPDQIRCLSGRRAAHLSGYIHKTLAHGRRQVTMLL